MLAANDTHQALKQLYHLRDLIRRQSGAVVVDELLPHQQPPPGNPGSDWSGWLIEGGRGSGKTAGIASYVTAHIEGPACIAGPMPHKMALIAPTLGDADESAERHPICLRTLRPDFRVSTSREGTVGKWPNGSTIKLFGTNTRRDVDRLRAGGNNCLVWVEELAAWPLLGVGFSEGEISDSDPWAHMRLGLRMGPGPHWVGSTTPKPNPAYRRIRQEPTIRITHGTMDDNPNLVESWKQLMRDLYDGTTLGLQELEGRMLDRIVGALWRDTWFNRVDDAPDYMQPVVVGVDPAFGGRDEAGVITAGLVRGQCPCNSIAPLPHAVVLSDLSIAGSSDTWARHVVQAYDDTEASFVAVEMNMGGDMVERTIRTVRRNLPIKPVRATRGKAVRAEPVAALYEQGRIHHLGSLPMLESELLTWVPGESTWSPGRLDALVWAITALGIAGPSEGSSGTAPNR